MYTFGVRILSSVLREGDKEVMEGEGETKRLKDDNWEEEKWDAVP